MIDKIKDAMKGAPAALFGLAGWSGSGKTTLAEQLITEWNAQGLDVATIKHAHHEFEADTRAKIAGGIERLVRARFLFLQRYDLRILLNMKLQNLNWHNC